MPRLSQISGCSRHPCGRRPGGDRREHQDRLRQSLPIARLAAIGRNVGIRYTQRVSRPNIGPTALEEDVLKSIGGALVVLAFAATSSTQAPAQDDFPIVGTYTENKACAGAVHIECKGAGGATMLGDVTFTIKTDGTLDFADQDNTYKAVLHKCPD
jgi:hypothetical protein